MNMRKTRKSMKIAKRAKKDSLVELQMVSTYGSVDFFQMKKVFPLLVTRILQLESHLKALQAHKRVVSKK